MRYKQNEKISRKEPKRQAEEVFINTFWNSNKVLSKDKEFLFGDEEKFQKILPETINKHIKPFALQSDALFFNILGIYPFIISAPFTLKKVLQWRKELQSNDKDVSYKAKENLKRIGTTLAFKGWAKKPKYDKETLKISRQIFLKWLKRGEILKCRNKYHAKMKLKELLTLFLGRQPIGIDISQFPTRYAELANVIVAQISGFSPTTVARYCKGKTLNQT